MLPPSASTPRQPTNTTRTPIGDAQCRNCGGIRHYARTCSSAIRPQPIRPRAAQLKLEDPETPIPDYVISSESALTGEWDDDKALGDGGATHHVTNNVGLLSHFTPLRDIPLFSATDTPPVVITGRGRLTVRGDDGRGIIIPNVYLCEKIRGTIISLPALKEIGCKLEYAGDNQKVYFPNNTSATAIYNARKWHFDIVKPPTYTPILQHLAMRTSPKPSATHPPPRLNLCYGTRDLGTSAPASSSVSSLNTWHQAYQTNSTPLPLPARPV